MTRDSNKKRILIFVLVSMLLSGLILPVRSLVLADAVTDTLAVRVGYSGMELKEYVEIGKWHWSDLARELTVYEQAFSYYKKDKSDGTEFTAIVDSARGFSLRDFLEFAGVYMGDIYNLQFYVKDHKGIQAKFDRNELFKTRYYFEDYNGHLKKTYDDDFNVVAVDSSECRRYARSVEPMMALEDNWVGFTQEFEHAYPDFEHANTSSRFRLLFGQTSPEESLTSESAKYVSCIFVTLTGRPKVGHTPDLDGDYGSHTIKIPVSVNDNVRDMASEFIKAKSTNTKVLRIRNITMQPDPFYEDVAYMIVDYEIIGEGSASITLNYSGSGTEIGGTGVITAKPKKDERPTKTSVVPPVQENDQDGDGTAPAQQPGDSGDDRDGARPAKDSEDNADNKESGEDPSAGEDGQDSTDKEKKEKTKSGKDADSKDSPKTKKKSNKETAKKDGTKKKKQQKKEKEKIDPVKEDPKEAVQPEQDNEVIKTEDPEPAEAQDQNAENAQDQEAAEAGASDGGEASQALSGYRISADVFNQLSEQKTEVTYVEQEVNVRKTEIEDNTEEKENERRMMLLFTGIGAAGMVTCGGAFEDISFRKRLRKRKSGKKENKEN